MVVRAKRLGWNEKLTDDQVWDLDPYESNDDNLEGELEEFDISATDEHSEIKMCLVGGQEADADTVEGYPHIVKLSGYRPYQELDEHPLAKPTSNSFCPGEYRDSSCSPENNGKAQPLPPLGKPIQASAEHLAKVVSAARRETGENNFASIHSVYKRSGLGREEFNNALLKSYQDGKLSLRLSEGFKSLSKEERESSFYQMGSNGAPETLAYISMRG